MNNTNLDIKLVVFDVDGVLTDGSLYYSENGECIKRFNVKDGVGLKLLQDKGIAVAIVSAKESEPLSRRISDLGIKHFYPGSKDKLATVHGIAQQLNISMHQVAMVGDDMVDLNVMRVCGLSIAPADAYVRVKSQVDWITEAKGGEGVAREVADRILSLYYDLDEIYQLTTTEYFERKR
ncbi:KdsC family phosphatase [Gynuella sunshinyii]|uniref:KdsC family phosphatase n=1 Tax=Gynuella sunshinyii TaxID=1445505 RepID=UPI0005CBCDA7|nr:HAD-IIIA family hydrolase [Gynuella sunshinyii]